MATQNNRAKNKKQTDKSGKTRSKSQNSKTVKKRKKKVDVKKEIIVLTLVITVIFFVAAIYFNSGGMVGIFFRTAIFGMFGISAYLLPVFLIALAIAYALGEKFEGFLTKVLLSFFIIISISVLSHVYKIDTEQITDSINDRSTFFPALGTYFYLASQSKITGGLIGGFLGDIIIIVLGKFGGKLITFLIITSLVIVIFETSVIALLKVLVKGIYKCYKYIKNFIEKEKAKKSERINKEDQELDEDDVTKFDEEIQSIYERNKGKGSFLDKSKMDISDKILNDIIEENSAKSNVIQGNFMDHSKTATNEGKSDVDISDDSMQISLFSENKDKAKNKDESSPIEKEIKRGNKDYQTNTLYEYPPYDLLTDPPTASGGNNKAELRYNAQKLQDTLESFNVGANIVNVSCGPTVTRYELQPEVGVKVSKIVNLTDDIALNLAATGIRIEAPIPGKALIGIEVPNKTVKSVYIKEVLENNKFKKFPSKIAFAVGKDISGETIIADIARMPHMLISGATGSGKSVCINSLITSILFRAHPDEVKLLMIDPKVVELKVYNGIPHLLVPVVTDPKKAAGALFWAVKEMEDRYKLFAAANVRDLKGYNKTVKDNNEGKKLPQVVIIVDELADLMQVAAKDVEEAICRLAQMARAAGIHLILATQRPSVDVITGVIKANIPSRIAFSVSSGVDSRTIIDMNGAEKLVGKGDMLYYPIGMNKPLRVQGAFISDKEVENVVNFLKAIEKPKYDKEIEEQINKSKTANNSSNSGESDLDEYFEQALELVVDKQKASASMIQRRFKVGYNRAARIMDQLFEAGYIGDEEGSKARKVLATREQLYSRSDSTDSHKIEE